MRLPSFSAIVTTALVAVGLFTMATRNEAPVWMALLFGAAGIIPGIALEFSRRNSQRDR
jgi:hypothetical protein